MEIEHKDGPVVILSGAGLSAASGVPTFRDADGLWEGHRVEEVATPAAWFRDRPLVRDFYDQRRIACARVKPNPGHTALARLQEEWGPDQVVLVTQNIDGLLTQAGASEVIEMHGSLWHLKCEADDDHPRVAIEGPQDPAACCSDCGALLRPDVVWFGEMPYAMGMIYAALSTCALFLSVGTSGLVYPAAGFTSQARTVGAYCVEINPNPVGGPFHQVLAEGSETALPRLVSAWLDG
ncbi:MAG: NAD-dependent deacylase [Myxococcota bacterium]|nr:NAD-dependent deacylase [Myxococcota bacterium]